MFPAGTDLEIKVSEDVDKNLHTMKSMLSEISEKILLNQVAELFAKDKGKCDNCHKRISEHCKVHLIPCCPDKCEGE